MINAIIVDDELPAREVIRNYLAEYCPDVIVIATADSAKSAYTAIHLHHPDLVFLDVEMPNGSGFDFLHELHRIDFRIIFITAYSEYAVKAFRFSATDYLLKPVSVKELIEAVGKVRQDIAGESLKQTNLETLKSLTQKQVNDFNTLVIADTGGFKVIDVKNIIHCEADGYCTNFYMTGKMELTSSKNLKYYEELFEEHGFMRVHNSHLVNLSHVKEYSKEGIIILTGNQTSPLGNTYKKKFMERFGKGR